MRGFLERARELFFGELTSSTSGLIISVLFVVGTIIYLIGAWRSLAEFVKAMDIAFNKDRLDDYNRGRPDGTPPRIIDWVKARKQQLRSVWFTIPLGVLSWLSAWW